MQQQHQAVPAMHMQAAQGKRSVQKQAPQDEHQPLASHQQRMLQAEKASCKKEAEVCVCVCVCACVLCVTLCVSLSLCICASLKKKKCLCRCVCVALIFSLANQSAQEEEETCGVLSKVKRRLEHNKRPGSYIYTYTYTCTCTCINT